MAGTEMSPTKLKMGAAALEAALRGLTTPGRGIAGHHVQGLPGVMGPEFVKAIACVYDWPGR